MRRRGVYALFPAVLDQVESRIVVGLGGREGECLIRNRYDHVGASDDYQQALNLMLHIVESGEPATAYFRWLEIRARRLIRAPQSRPRLDTLAAALMDARHDQRTRCFLDHGEGRVERGAARNPPH